MGWLVANTKTKRKKTTKNRQKALKTSIFNFLKNVFFNFSHFVPKTQHTKNQDSITKNVGSGTVGKTALSQPVHVLCRVVLGKYHFLLVSTEQQLSAEDKERDSGSYSDEEKDKTSPLKTRQKDKAFTPRERGMVSMTKLVVTLGSPGLVALSLLSYLPYLLIGQNIIKPS